jgi:hypothetical protein
MSGLTAIQFERAQTFQDQMIFAAMRLGWKVSIDGGDMFLFEKEIDGVKGSMFAETEILGIDEVFYRMRINHEKFDEFFNVEDCSEETKEKFKNEVKRLIEEITPYYGLDNGHFEPPAALEEIIDRIVYMHDNYSLFLKRLNKVKKRKNKLKSYYKGKIDTLANILMLITEYYYIDCSSLSEELIDFFD